MAFFGLTSYGTNNFASNSAHTQYYFFHEVPEEKYVEVFNKNLLGDSNIAQTLQVDGSETILREKLGDMLSDILDRKPAKHELDAWFTFCDFDRICYMSFSEYLASVQNVRQFSAAPGQAKTYTSYELKNTDWLRHRRVEYDPQHTQKQALTTSQQVGWHTMKPTPDREFYPQNSTDVSKGEGRDIKSYYGHYIFQ